MSARILVVDDEPVIREILGEFLGLEGYEIHSVDSGQEALTQLRIRPFDLVISDLKMPGMTGLDVLATIQKEEIPVAVILMTGFGTVETAISAMKQGATDYLLKPFKIEEVLRVIARALETRKLQSENIRLRESLNLYKVSEAIASTLELEKVLDVILNVALEESQADAVSLHLLEPSTHDELPTAILDKHIVKWAPGANPSWNKRLADPNLEHMLRTFSAGSAVIDHGNQMDAFFAKSVADNVVSFAAVPLAVSGTVIGAVNIYSFTQGKQFSEGVRKMLSVWASRAAMAIRNAQYFSDLTEKNEKLTQAHHSLEQNFEQTIAAFAQALEESDQYTRGHSERVALYSRLIAEQIGMKDSDVALVIRAGLLHDVGKIGIRYGIINKPGPLTKEEVSEFQKHPDIGKRILDPIPSLHTLIDGAWCHHESFVGGGYPRGLSGQKIPAIGRLVAVADAYDAMTSDRSYRKALPHEAAIAEIKRCTGTQFDPEFVEAFLFAIEKWRENDAKTK